MLIAHLSLAFRHFREGGCRKPMFVVCVYGAVSSVPLAFVFASGAKTVGYAVEYFLFPTFREKREA